MNALPSLTSDEARTRAALLSVERYDIEVDLTGLAEGSVLRAVSRITFSSREAGATTFVDCAADVVSASLNGRSLTGDAVGGARVRLDSLQERNTLVVESLQRSTERGTGVHRSVDATDNEVYVWTSFEPDEARRAWACFDQPDLKAPFAFTVTAPANWRVVSNSNSREPEDLGESRRWVFPETPPLSTYVPVVNAGPFHEIRSCRDGFDLGLLSRRSLATFLERDAEELFRLTTAGLAFFGERFALPFPQRSYDQVFVPDMGGAMENYGCVTYSDSFIYRRTPSPSERELRAEVLLHEMAHMWFGDIVTMRWWDDLWLNEAFAEWASHWAAEAATEFTDAWASFLASSKAGAYQVDRGPTSHPIRQPAPSVAVATAGFDQITYTKGASVLKQLVAYVGEQNFVEGLRSYFAAHAWGNATLADLMRHLADASDRDLTAWTKGWLETAGPDTLALEAAEGSGFVLRASGPDGTPARPHRLDVGVYEQRGDALVRRNLVEVRVNGGVTPLPVLGDEPTLVLINDNDLTFATVRPDASVTHQLLAYAAALPTGTSRAVAVSTLWDLVVTAEISAAQFVECATAVLVKEPVEPLIEPFLRHTVQAAEFWAPADRRDALLHCIADACLRIAEHGGARRLVAMRALARSAVTEDHFTALRKGTNGDIDLQWRRLTRLAALGRMDRDAVVDVQSRDRDPDAWVRALGVESAQPDLAAKEAVWRAAMEEHKVPIGSMFALAAAFWQPSQADVLAPFSERYLAALPGLAGAGMIPAMAKASAMFPVVGAGTDFMDRVAAVASSPAVSPVVANRVRERTEQLRSMVAARSLAESP